MPEAETLPPDIRAITTKNAAFLFHQLFDESVGKVIENINHTFAKTEPVILPERDADISTKPAEGTGRINIHRSGELIAYRARAFTIKVDGKDRTRINNDETVVIDLPPGTYTVSVHIDYHHPEQRVQIKCGEIQEFRVTLKNFGLQVLLERM